jgi:hypothetical protein
VRHREKVLKVTEVCSPARGPTASRKREGRQARAEAGGHLNKSRRAAEAAAGKLCSILSVMGL